MTHPVAIDALLERTEPGVYVAHEGTPVLWGVARLEDYGCATELWTLESGEPTDAAFRDDWMTEESARNFMLDDVEYCRRHNHFTGTAPARTTPPSQSPRPP